MAEACWLFGIKDITERKQAERLVQEREALLSLTIEAAALALWDINLQTGEVSGDRQWRELLGCRRGGRSRPSLEQHRPPRGPRRAFEALARHGNTPTSPST
jgi:PAS domain-containing protein